MATGRRAPWGRIFDEEGRLSEAGSVIRMVEVITQDDAHGSWDREGFRHHSEPLAA